MLRYDDLERIVTGFNEAEARGNVSSFSPRPAHVTESNIGSIYAEGPGYSRRRSYRYEKCQTWKSSGGELLASNYPTHELFIAVHGRAGFPARGYAGLVTCSLRTRASTLAGDI